MMSMMKYSFYMFFIILCLYGLSGQAAEDEKKNIKQQDVVNWIFEDPTPDNGWDYCETWRSGNDYLGINRDNNYVLVSKKEQFQGKTCLELRIKHYPEGYCGVMLPAGIDNTGRPPRSKIEADTGKDISSCDTLEFWIKGTGNKVKDIKIEIVDQSFAYSDRLVLSDLFTIDQTWKKVEIPLDEFSWSQQFNKRNIRAVSFLVDESMPFGEYFIFIDNLRFIKKGRVLNDRFKVLFEDISVQDGAWNFSGVFIEQNGTTIEKSPFHENLPISTKEQYKGYSCLKLHVKHATNGFAGVYFSTTKNGLGVPPDSWDDFDALKDISPFNALRFYVKSEGGTAGGLLEFADLDKNAVARINLSDFVEVNSQWQEVVIPFEFIEWGIFNKKRFKEFKYYVDDLIPAGEFTLYIDNLEFIKLPK